MKITSGFDRKNGQFYVVALIAMAFASGLMLVAAFRGFAPCSAPQEVQLATAVLSLLCSTASYLVVDRTERSAHLLGLSATIFSAALWTFGVPTAFVLLLALPAVAMMLISLIYKDRADRQVESDD